MDRESRADFRGLGPGGHSLGRQLGLQLRRRLQGHTAQITAHHVISSQRDDRDEEQREPPLRLNRGLNSVLPALGACTLHLSDGLGFRSRPQKKKHVLLLFDVIWQGLSRYSIRKWGQQPYRSNVKG